MSWLRELFTLRGTVGRLRYLAVGLGLALLKYAVDAGCYFAWTGKFWGPTTYLDPNFGKRMEEVDHLPTGYLAFLVVWALPFLWIGVAMSARRAREAGLSRWLALGFLLPMVSYVTILGLLLSPPRSVRADVQDLDEFSFRTALFGLAFTVLGGTALIALLTEGMEYYGTALFLGVPFLLGTITGFLFNAPKERSIPATIGTATLALLAGFLAMLAFALEGLVCLTMAFPVMLAAVIPGSLFGRSLGRMAVVPDRTLGLVILFLPLGALAQQHWTEPDQREVMTAIEIDAPPEVVWENVVSFSELPPPDDWLLRTGIAYPLRARIEGEGVGAVRYCEFTTGPFVEPITHWDAPRRLSFDVREQPDPMQEWSFYAHVNAPHLEQSFRSVRGEFRLTALPGGRTRLEGSTWYVMEMGPEHYWKLWGDGIVHRIHGRVLRHIRRLSESASHQARD
jgi:uncharacterized membrane protein YhaH (DUF805 family)